MKRDIEFERSCDRIASLFSELAAIILTIKNEFKQEHKQDPGLTIEIVNDRLNMVSSYEKNFLGYKKREMSNWSLEKYINYSIQYLYSFFRIFDNPFLGSQKWYQKIVELISRLSSETSILENILKTDSD